MTSPGRQLVIETGVVPVELAVSTIGPAKPVLLDSGLSECNRQEEINNTLTGLMAIGMRRWDAIVSMINGSLAIHDEFVDLDGIPPKMLKVYDSVMQAVDAFDKLAVKAPVAANLCLNVWLYGSGVDGDLDLSGIEWVTSLPEGLNVSGILSASDCSALSCLPDGMTIGGSMDVRYCGISKLPNRLIVGEYLDIQGCCNWDGVIPDDIRAARVYSEEYAGVTVELWRELMKESKNIGNLDGAYDG